MNRNFIEWTIGAVLMIYEIYEGLNYTGIYKLVAETQLDLMGSYSIKLTIALEMLALTIIWLGALKLLNALFGIGPGKVESFIKQGTDRDIVSAQLNETIESQIRSYKRDYNKTIYRESDNDKQSIADKDLTLRRKNGRWQLFVPVEFSNWKSSHNFFEAYKVIDCTLPKNLVSYDNLY